jgi:hypothetical protein
LGGATKAWKSAAVWKYDLPAIGIGACDGLVLHESTIEAVQVIWKYSTMMRW